MAFTSLMNLMKKCARTSKPWKHKLRVGMIDMKGSIRLTMRNRYVNFSTIVTFSNPKRKVFSVKYLYLLSVESNPNLKT